jgi:hypothetical protein
VQLFEAAELVFTISSTLPWYCESGTVWPFICWASKS